MSIESSKDRLELQRENMKRLEVLMGEDYNSIEMEDFKSYVPLEDASMEINGLEERLKKGRKDRGQILEGFKFHISYVYAAR